MQTVRLISKKEFFMLYAIVAVLALLLDQAVKYYVTLQIDLNTGVQPVIP